MQLFYVYLNWFWCNLLLKCASILYTPAFDIVVIVCSLLQIFTERSDSEPADDRLKPNIIVDYLSKFSQAVIIYLEFLIFTKKLEVTFDSLHILCMCIPILYAGKFSGIVCCNILCLVAEIFMQKNSVLTKFCHLTLGSLVSM